MTTHTATGPRAWTNRFGDRAWVNGDDPLTRCLGVNDQPCVLRRMHDGWCGYHLAYLEHVSDYFGPPHTGEHVDADCWFCPQPPATLSRLAEERLADLAALPAGWYDGHGEPVTPAALAGARDLLAAAGLVDAAGLALSATEEGGITCEDGYLPGESLSIDVEPDGTLVLVLPMTAAEWADPATDDGIPFADAAALWAHADATRATNRTAARPQDGGR